jgi:hypothetical protein
VEALVIYAVTNRDPLFLKEAYKHPDIQLINHEGFVPPGQRYITWDGQWRLWKMLPERVPIPQGRFKTLNTAIFYLMR